MNIEYNQIQQVKSISEVDMDLLLDASLDAMNSGTFKWPENINTNEEKREYYKTLISHIIRLPQYFSFKRTIDGVDVSLNVGIIKDDYWMYTHALVGNLNGSKSWIYDEKITPQQTQFLIDSGFTGVLMNSYGESAVLQHQTKKYESIGATIYDSVVINSETNLIQTKVDFTSASLHIAETPSDTRLS